MFRGHDRSVYAGVRGVTADGVVLARALALARCVLRCSGSELGVKRWDALGLVGSFSQA